MTTIPVVQNDFGYNIEFFLENADGSAFDLTGVSAVMFRAQRVNNPSVRFSGNMVVDNAAQGQCHYVVSSPNFNVSTTYNVQIQAVFTTTELVTWTNIQVIASPEVPFPA